MLYALINETRVKAERGKKGACPCCKALLIPKCGDIKVWHWAHERAESCDSWSEGETSWHLHWKEYFDPVECEVIITKNGERHIADILTSEGIVIEIQNSPIDSRIIRQREIFYGGSMVWIVNGESFKHNLFIYKIDEDYREYWNKYYRSAPTPYCGEMYTFSGEELSPELKKIFQYYEYEEIEKDIYASKHPDLEESPEPSLLKRAVVNQIKYIELKKYFKAAVKRNEDNLYTFNWKWFRSSWCAAKRPVFIDLNNGYMFHVSTFWEYGGGVLSIYEKEEFLKQFSKAFKSI